jgi:lipopolysaccharide transport system permease protein
MTSPADDRIDISPATDTTFGGWQELWRWRFLVVVLTVRDVKLRYKQTVLGFGVVIVRPFVSAMIMAFVLGQVANLSTGDIPLFVFGFIGSTLWFYFNHSLTASAQSLLKESDILTKVHVPHFIPVLASTLSSYVDFLVSFAVLVAYLLLSGFAPAWTILLSPFVAALTPAAVLAFSLFLAPLIGLFRDFREIGNIILQFLLFLSPVYYPFSKVPEYVQPLLALNPALWIIELFRASVLGTLTTDPFWLGLSFASCLVCCVTGILFFRVLDRVMIDFL